MENVMDMAPLPFYSLDQRSMHRSTVVDGKVERNMYEFETFFLLLKYMQSVTHVLSGCDLPLFPGLRDLLLQQLSSV